MANVLVRSPYFIPAQQGLAQNGTATLTITIAGTLRYTITKTASSNGRVLFEISELLRDYLNPLLSTQNGGYGIFSQSVAFILNIQFKNSSGSNVGTPVAMNGIMMDGYGYFLEGDNPTTTRGCMQSNDIIYRLKNTAIKIPVDINNTEWITFLNNNEIVSQVKFSGNSNFALNYAVSDNVQYNKDSFQNRVYVENGIIENSDCLVKFFDGNDIFDVDEVRVETTDGLKILKVITLDECRYKPVKVIFFNRWGATQELWFFRKSVESLTSSREEFKRSMISISGEYDPLVHPRSNFNVQSKRKITINTGYVDDSYNELMQELMQSEKVWIEQDSVTYPVVVTTNSLTFKTGVNDKLVDYSLDLDYAYDEIQNIR